MSDETGGVPGLDTWEALHAQQQSLQLRREQFDQKLEDVDPELAVEPWEMQLNEAWPDMQARLERDLRSNPLDNEVRPFSEITGGRSLVDRKTSDGKPTTIVWQAAPNPEDEGEATKQNSDHVMASLKHWGLEPPNMALLVYGGSLHPWQLIHIQRMQDQRADFLQSRPRFNDSYFDGQRDPAQGWMAVGNAWRYPAFYTSPAYQPPEFTFRPPHTLFIDAALQVQEDHELMEHGDFTINEWIMDAVTHQPIGRQPAIKGMDDVFYWDLSATPMRKGGSVTPIDVDLRLRYVEWAQGVKTQHAKQGRSPDVQRSKYLTGSTKRRSIDRWGSLTARLLLHEKQRKRAAEDHRLVEGEIRIELTSLKLYKPGLAKLNSLVPQAQVSSIANAMSLGTMTMSAMSGEVLVIVKLMIPGEDELVSDPVRMSRGPIPKLVKVKGLSRRAYFHRGVGQDQEMLARSIFLQEILASKNPMDSLTKVSVVLADDTGAEIEGAEIATFEQSLKELIHDVPCDDHGQHELNGDIEVFGYPPGKEKRGSRGRITTAGAPSPAPATGSRLSFGLSRSATTPNLSLDAIGSQSSGNLLASTPQKSASERPIAMGKVIGRIAIRPMKEALAPSTESAIAKLHSKSVAAVSRSRKSLSKVAPLDSVLGLSPSTRIAARSDTTPQIRAPAALEIHSTPQPPPEMSPPPPPPDMATPFSPSSTPPPPGEDLVEEDAFTPPPSPPEVDLDDESDHGNEGEDAPDGTSNMALLTGAIRRTHEQKHTLVYTIAYWIKWRTIQSIGDQRLLFGDATNQPMLVRGNRLGALVNNNFCATEYDPRWNGDNWQLAVVTCDGNFSRFYLGFSSTDESGLPEAARAEDPIPGRAITDIRTEISGEAAIRRLNTAGQGAGWLAQAWIWPRDLQPDEVRELWMNTKSRYPVARRGLPSGGLSVGAQYRPPPNPFADATGSKTGGMAPGTGITPEQEARERAARSTRKLPPMPPESGQKNPFAQPQTKAVAAKIIDRETSAMLEVPLVNKLAFQRLLNVFTVLVEYAINSKSYIVIDRIHNYSCTAELMLELALRKNPTSTPPVIVLDTKTRLVKANHKLKQLKRANFLEKGVKVTSIDFLNASLRQLVTPAGLSWLRASSSDLQSVTQELARRPDDRKLDARRVTEIYDMYGDEDDLRRDGRPRTEHIWKCFYSASLFASGTNYIIFDHVDMKGRSVLEALGTRGSIFLSGSTFEHKKIKECIQYGSPVLLLESTGGVTQAFAHAMKAVRLLKPNWPVDKVLRLVTEYKLRAANDPMQPQASRRLVIEHVQYLDKELARIDVLLSSEERAETWMRAFGLPEILLLFEMWQRAPTFLMRQIQMADVMKKSAEALLSIFTDTFSNGASAVPELGLGPAETKVVATAWNRHLLLFHNGDKYNVRSWTVQLVMYVLAIGTTVLAVVTITNPVLEGDKQLTAIMLILPIISALLGTIGTRLRMREKFAHCKMASFEIVSEIYKYRVRAIEYDQLALAAAEAAKESSSKDKKKDDEEPAKPISAERLGKICRKQFVKKIQFIYTTCMKAELSTGTAITHTSRVGLDPARLLRDFDSGDDDSVKELRGALQLHVAERLYFLKSLEWEKGVDGYKEWIERKRARRNKQIKAAIQSRVRDCIFACLGLCINTLASGEKSYMDSRARYKHRMAVARGEATDDTKDRFRIKYSSEEAEGEKAAAASTPSKQTWLQSVSAKLSRKDLVPHPLDEDNKVEAMVDKLDLTYRYVDDDEEQAHASEDVESGSSGRAGDNLFGPLSIEDYVRYRARPVCTYLERTAPWRAFELQFLEILVFVINSLGAVFVGLGSAFVPYVTVTVAIAAALKSFTDFANLAKQVESYNAALRDVHNCMNDWDSKTSTERRTHQAITQMVGTIEGALTVVAIALTDAQPSSAAAQEGEDGEGGDNEDKDK